MAFTGEGWLMPRLQGEEDNQSRGGIGDDGDDSDEESEESEDEAMQAEDGVESDGEEEGQQEEAHQEQEEEEEEEEEKAEAQHEEAKQEEEKQREEAEEEEEKREEEKHPKGRRTGKRRATATIEEGGRTKGQTREAEAIKDGEKGAQIKEGPADTEEKEEHSKGRQARPRCASTRTKGRGRGKGQKQPPEFIDLLSSDDEADVVDLNDAPDAEESLDFDIVLDPAPAPVVPVVGKGARHGTPSFSWKTGAWMAREREMAAGSSGGIKQRLDALSRAIFGDRDDEEEEEECVQAGGGMGGDGGGKAKRRRKEAHA
jgi:hypothetical protein